MKLDPVIESLLDTDLYKFNMNQVMFHTHTDLIGEYHFKCRNKGVVFTREMFDEINSQIDHLCTLTFRPDELAFLKSIRFIKPDYVEFLRLWHPIRDYVFTDLNEATGELTVKVKGPLFSAMQFEIYLLEIINEVYFRMKYDYSALLKSAKEKLDRKIRDFQNQKYTFRFAEFGCRRRLSREWQDVVVRRFAKETNNMVGTSNVYLAFKYNLIPIGTYAHEFVQMYQGISKIPLAYTNYYAMKDWYHEYNGDNGTALTDTVTTDLFLLDFDRSMANNFTGVRHDSGDPFIWGEKMIAHYQKYGIDPKSKTLLFSDSLDFDKAQKLYNYFNNRVKVSFGIGTFVSNDTEVDPLNIVIKLQYVNGNPVAKLSDAEGKTMCADPGYESYLRSSVDFRLSREGVPQAKKEPKWLYRLESTNPENGLWYNSHGEFCWGINALPNCETKNLPMGYDARYQKDGRQWFSSCSNPEDLMHWFSVQDTLNLVAQGFEFARYLATEYEEYPLETTFIKGSALKREVMDIRDLFKE